MAKTNKEFFNTEKYRSVVGSVTANDDLLTQDLSAVGNIYVHGTVDGRDISADGLLVDSVYTSSSETSANWDAVYTNVADTSAKRDSVYTSVSDTSANWDVVYSNVAATSADRDSVYTSSSETSANWDSVYTSSSETSANWDSVYTSSSDTSANWDSVYTSVSDTSANWDSVYTSSSETSANWDTAYTDSQANNAVRAVSADWNSVYTSSSETSGEWDSVYTFINTTSATEGYATLLNGKLDESQVPNLSITDVHVVTYNSDVSAMCDPNDHTYQEIERGDVLVITSLSGYNLIATTDSPTGIYNPFDDTFDDFQKLIFPQDYVKSVNGKQGLNGNVILNPDDLDDTNTAHKFVTATQRLNWDSNYTSTSETSASWDSVYSWVNSDSATNNTDYNQTHFVNASGDTITGNLHITGDLRVDGNAYLSAGTSGIINVGDQDTDNVIFHADVNSNITPQTDVTHNLGNIDQQWQTVYVQDISASRDVNINGFTQLDKTHIDTTEGDFVVSGSNQVTLTVPLSVDNDVHITGDLRVDGNAWLSAGTSGVINVGDQNTDNVVFHADVNSTVIPNITDTYSLGTPDQRWSIIHTASAEVDDFTVKNLTVTETTILSGKSDQGPGVIIKGTPTGIFDVGTRGFEDREGDYMIPDVDITGDVVLHGSLSADNAHIYSLTASNFKAEYQKLVVNDGDLELWNGNIRQRGGNVLIESDIGHIDDENTYIRFQPDQLKMVCHDVNMIQFNEYPIADDIIILGDTSDAVDIKVQNPADNNTLYIDGDTARIGISTDSPLEKFHIYNGQAQFATGAENGAVMITSGKTDERVDKRGSIRWNTDLNRYEGYLSHDGSWSSLNSIGDTDGDTYIDIDAESEHYPDSDRLALYTAGCSAMTIHPNQTVVFAGDIQFDNITIYDNNSVTGPLTATSEFIYLSINGNIKAIRLWETPKDTREDIETFHGDSLVHIGDPCGLGHLGQIPTQTISAQNVLFSPPTQ
jgi:cytoskeletal protein CcmA (bactofilin family)